MTKKEKKKGNPKIAEAGKATRFPPGISANPGGRTKTASLSEALRIVAGMNVKELKPLPTDSVPIAIAKALVRKALKGHTPSISEIFDRVEGRAPQSVRLEDKGPKTHTVVVEYEQVAYKNPPPDKTLFDQLTEIVKNSKNAELMQRAADLALLLKKETESYGKP
jgi:hypothetical protein